MGSVPASGTGGAQKLMLRFRRVRFAADLFGEPRPWKAYPHP